MSECLLMFDNKTSDCNDNVASTMGLPTVTLPSNENGLSLGLRSFHIRI